MKSRFPIRGFLRFNSSAPPTKPAPPLPAQSSYEHGSSSSSPKKQGLWFRVALVSAAAAGVGAYIRSQQSKSSVLNPVTFTPYYLVSKEPVSSTGSLFTLRPSHAGGSNAQVYEDAWKTGVWSVMFKQPQLQIGRDYTPLPSWTAVEDQEGSLRFFIRRDAFGEMSRYLHNLEVGTPVDIRGPRIECEIPPDTQQVLFIAGGTGIAPALQAGYTLLSRDGPSPESRRIHILWANRQRNDCAGGRSDHTATTGETKQPWLPSIFRSSTNHQKPPSDINHRPSHVVQELEALKAQYPGQVTVEYFVDEEGTSITKQHITDFTNSSPAQQRKMILVSGPEGFISYMAGPKLWAQGMELQGPLRGILRELDLKDWAVWKL
ncbi:ferredoxin reductase-like protein [Aspergillus taichungensis]|uniref:Ferredoxin reductase-like protein n=1 Tax=Aspergillus taichungensis TaxID=482145 RepID=A0A2J5HPT7_9EURO|nr:ferredoxin reductase-like protein [Aspergillus taichungensis]